VIRAGLIGCGNIFERGYLPALPTVEGLTIGATCDLIQERAALAAGKTGAAAAVTDARALLARDDLDAVFILTPTHTHAELAIQALEAGKHVLCEKPMARSSSDAQHMTDAARQAGKRLMIGHTRRFDDRWIAMRELVRSGQLGELSYIFRSEHAFNGAPASAWQWNDARSGGVLWDVGVHIAELFGWFFDRAPRRAYGRTLHVRPESNDDGGAPDGAVVQFDFGPRQQAMLSVSWFHPPQWAPFYATMDLVGTAGKASYVDQAMHALRVVNGGITHPRYSPLLSSIASAFGRELAHFVRAVEHDEPFAVPVEAAQAAVAAVEAAERSAHSGLSEAVAEVVAA
jgi:UDP-N-acetylglucosamine 3-dehydrogenase